MAATATVQVGIDAEVYRNTASFSTPTWVAIGLVRDANTSAKWNRADASARQTKAVLQAKTQIAITGQIVVRADPLDAAYRALFDAAMADSTSAPDLLILDGPITQEGANGIRGHMNLDFAQNQGIGDTIYTTFDYDPAWKSDGYPSKVTVAAGSTLTLTQF